MIGVIHNMKDQSYKVLQYLQENNNQTANKVAEGLNMTKRLVDSIFSSAIVKNELGERVSVSNDILLSLNDKGLKYKQ